MYSNAIRKYDKSILSISEICIKKYTIIIFETISNPPGQFYYVRKELPTGKCKKKMLKWEDKVLEQILINIRKKTSKEISSELMNVHGINLSARSVRSWLVEYNPCG